MRSDLPILVAAILLAPLSAAATMHDSLTLMLGDNEQGAAELVFSSEMTATDAFTLRTVRVGAPDSVLRVEVDSIPYPLIEHTLTSEDCSFASGEAVCEVQIDGSSRAFADLVAAFRAGLDAHLEVTTGGHAAMQTTTSLQGFSDAFDAL